MLMRGLLRGPHLESVANCYVILGYCSQEPGSHMVESHSQSIRKYTGGGGGDGGGWREKVRHPGSLSSVFWSCVACNVGRPSTVRRPTGQLGASPVHLWVTHLAGLIPTKPARTAAAMGNQGFLQKASTTAA